MTGTRLKLVCGGRELDLADGTNYAVGEGWHPPMTGLSSQLGGNVRELDGQVITDRQAADRRISIPIMLLGSTITEKQHQARRVDTFIADSLKSKEKLYLHMNGYDDIPEPVWGQLGADLRLWVKDGGFSMSPGWGSGQRVSNVLDNNILDLLVSPVGYGKRQRLLTGTGTLQYYRAGKSDPFARGIVMTGGATNLFTNPVYGYSTWNNGWTAGGSVTETQNTNDEYIFFGENSAHLVMDNSDVASGRRYTQSLTLTAATSYYMAFVCKRADGGAVSSSVCQVFYDSDAVGGETYINLGNGWWLVYVGVTGTGSAAASGVYLASNVDVYVDAFYCAQTGIYRYPHYGDQLDCAWSSTAHDSTSTGTNYFITGSTENMSAGSGTINIVLRPIAAHDEGGYGSNTIVWDARVGGTSSLVLRWNGGSGSTFQFGDGTNSALSTAQTWAAGDVLVLTCTWGKTNGLTIYRDGAQIATQSTFTPSALNSTFAVLSDLSAANRAWGLFMGLAIWDREFTATQVSSLYDQIDPLASTYQRVSYLPVMWTDDGDGNLDSIYSASDENYAVILDIPGDEKAQTEIYATQTTAVGTDRNLFLANMDTYEYMDFGSTLFFNQSSKVTSVDAATYDAITNTETLDYRWAEEFNNRQWYAFVYFTDAGTENLLAYQVIDYYQSTDQSINDSTLWPHTAPLSHYRRYTNAFFPNRDIYFYVMAKRTGGSASNVTTSYFMLVPSPLIYIGMNPTANNASFWYQSEGGYVDVELAGSPTSYQTVRARGDTLEFVPDRYNTLIYAPTSRGVIYLAVNSIYVTPRWGLV